MVTTSVRWSLFAGGYAFLLGVLLFLPLGVVAETLAIVLGLPAGLATVVVPGSGAVIGAAVWWAIVERRSRDGYLLGGVAGLATGVLTVLVWALVIATVYGPWALVSARVVVGFVLAVTAPVAFVAGLPFMYARLRLADRPPVRSGATA